MSSSGKDDPTAERAVMDEMRRQVRNHALAELNELFDLRHAIIGPQGEMDGNAVQLATRALANVSRAIHDMLAADPASTTRRARILSRLADASLQASRAVVVLLSERSHDEGDDEPRSPNPEPDHAA